MVTLVAMEPKESHFFYEDSIANSLTRHEHGQTDGQKDDFSDGSSDGYDHSYDHLRSSTSYSRLILSVILLGRCFEIIHIVRFISSFKDALASIASVLPGVLVHLSTVLFSIMHVFACIGMQIFPEHGVNSSSLYDVVNFENYMNSLVTLFNMLIVNNWNVVESGYEMKYSGYVFIYFAAYNVMAVACCLATVTAYFVLAFLTRYPASTEHKPQGMIIYMRHVMIALV